jgi:hypothetical protein
MEETEALATKVTILATRVLASGSLPNLRKEYGGHFHVRGTYSGEMAGREAEIERLLEDKFGDQISNLTVRYGEAEFELPHVTRQLGHIMEKMESMVIGGKYVPAGSQATATAGGAGTAESRGEVFTGYVVMEPTIEEVFMKVCQRASLIAPIGGD